MPGVVAIACIFQGIQAVALPLVQEFGFTREIEDRVMAPLPIVGVAIEQGGGRRDPGDVRRARGVPAGGVDPGDAGAPRSCSGGDS